MPTRSCSEHGTPSKSASNERTAELQQRTLELEAANRSLEAANKELESFSYSVSHDLRAPLRSMDGFSLALLEDYGDKLDGEAKEYLQYIRSSSQLMGRLIDDILNLSRITRAEVHLDRVDLSALAQEVVEELKRTQPGRRVEFVIAPHLEALADRNLLRLVLQNLLGNAFKFTGNQPAARIEFGVTTGAEPAYFVRDNGVGFDMAYADKLFKPFQRLHRRRGVPRHRHRAGIRAAHHPPARRRGLGRRPSRQGRHLLLHPARTLRRNTMPEKIILLVEDNPEDVTLTLRALKRSNIANQLVVARDGVEALDYLFGTGAHAGRDINRSAGGRPARPEAAESRWHRGPPARPGQPA